MDKSKEATDKLLSQVLQQCSDQSSPAKELAFLDTALDFLNRRSTVLAQPGISNVVLQTVHQHINRAKKQEIAQQRLNKPKEKSTSGITSATKKSIPEKEAEKLEKADDSKSQTNAKKEEKEADVSKKVKSDDEEEEEEDKGPKPEGNGGQTDTYKWIQTLSEVEMSLPIDANLRGRNLVIRIRPKRLFVAVKGKESTPIIDGELHEPVDTGESTWTLDKEHGKTTKTLTIILCKVRGMNWWNCVIKGDASIDTSKIEPENSKLNDLDDDTRQTVEKMMFDQRQKAKGLPSSKELEQAKIMERFKAQHPEMDFSKLQMAPDGMNSFAKR